MPCEGHPLATLSCIKTARAPPPSPPVPPASGGGEVALGGSLACPVGLQHIKASSSLCFQCLNQTSAGRRKGTNGNYLQQNDSLCLGSALESCPVPLTSTVHLGEGAVCAAADILLLWQVPAEKQLPDVWSNVKVNKKKKEKKRHPKPAWMESNKLHHAESTATINTCRVRPTLGFQNERESIWFALHSAHTFCLHLDSSPAPPSHPPGMSLVIACKALPSAACQEKASMTQQGPCRTPGLALPWKHPNCSKKHFCPC